MSGYNSNVDYNIDYNRKEKYLVLCISIKSNNLIDDNIFIIYDWINNVYIIKGKITNSDTTKSDISLKSSSFKVIPILLRDIINSMETNMNLHCIVYSKIEYNIMLPYYVSNVLYDELLICNISNNKYMYISEENFEYQIKDQLDIIKNVEHICYEDEYNEDEYNQDEYNQDEVCDDTWYKESFY